MLEWESGAFYCQEGLSFKKTITNKYKLFPLLCTPPLHLPNDNDPRQGVVPQKKLDLPTLLE